MLNSTHAHRQDGLYYADSKAFVKFCKTELSENVTLTDDYDDEEWMIFVKR